jgi:hypothetical protein
MGEREESGTLSLEGEGRKQRPFSLGGEGKRAEPSPWRERVG